jgi:hypothetical protein
MGILFSFYPITSPLRINNTVPPLTVSFETISIIINLLGKAIPLFSAHLHSQHLKVFSRGGVFSAINFPIIINKEYLCKPMTYNYAL